MTSANVTEYSIINKKTGEQVGNHRQHHYCKSKWNELIEKYVPLEDFNIQAYWYDEEEEYQEDEPEDLWEFLVRVGEIKLK